MIDDDGLILNLSFNQQSSPNSVSNTSVKKQYVIEGGSTYERKVIRRALKTQKEKRLGINMTTDDNLNDPNELPLGKKRTFGGQPKIKYIHDEEERKTSPPKKTNRKDTSTAALFRKKRKVNDSTNAVSVKNPSKISYREKREGEDKDTFVSSLFGPEASNALEKNSQFDKSEDDDSVKEPSNAPLEGSTLTFEELGISKFLTRVMQDKMKISFPTNIQRAVIPIALKRSDKDLFVQAQTGSGKTLAFVLPIIQRINEQNNLLLEDNKPRLDRQSGLFGIILVPTRELAAQIYHVLESFQSVCHWIVPGIVSGGEKKKSEKARIRKGVNILVATPGRFADHIDTTESLNLSSVRWLILDECDRLMELGFEETISKILKEINSKCQIERTISKYSLLPKKRINILCSATVKGKVQELGNSSLTDAEWVTSENVNRTAENIMKSSEFGENDSTDYTAPSQLIQNAVIVPAKLRLVTLAATLKNTKKRQNKDSDISRVIVFFSCSDSVEFHFSVFTREANLGENSNEERNKKDLKVGCFQENNLATIKNSPWLGKNTIIYKLHGSLNQATRTSTLAAFFGKTRNRDNCNTNESENIIKTDMVSILFCTDVASRGLDLPQITDVVEYDPPFSTDDHIHRVGRTARAGKKGTSTIFLLPGNEETYLKEIEQYHPNGIKRIRYENVLQKAFADDIKTSTSTDDAHSQKRVRNEKIDWEVEATTWHLNIERWLLVNEDAQNKAKRGFTSHIRAYATHLVSQRTIFNLKELHLGHVAKSFGLREPPGKMSSANSKKRHASVSSDRNYKGVNKRIENGFTYSNDRDSRETESQPGRKQLMAKAKQLNSFRSQMSEFNII